MDYIETKVLWLTAGEALNVPALGIKGQAFFPFVAKGATAMTFGSLTHSDDMQRAVKGPFFTNYDLI